MDCCREWTPAVFLHNENTVFLFFNTLLVCHFEFKIRHQGQKQLERYQPWFQVQYFVRKLLLKIYSSIYLLVVEVQKERN